MGADHPARPHRQRRRRRDRRRDRSAALIPTDELLERHHPILLATRGDRFLAGVHVYAARRGDWLEYWIGWPGDRDHTGLDAELALVHVNDRDEPTEAVYAKHRGAHRRDWVDVRKRGLRPEVYASKNKHASYFTAGWYRHGRHIERAAGNVPLDPPLTLGVPVVLQTRLAFRDPNRWVAANT